MASCFAWLIVDAVLLKSALSGQPFPFGVKPVIAGIPMPKAPQLPVGAQPVIAEIPKNERRRRVKGTLGFNDYMKYATRLFRLTAYVPGRDDSLLRDGSMAYLVKSHSVWLDQSSSSSGLLPWIH